MQWIVLKVMLCAELDLKSFVYRDLSLSFKAQCLPQMKGGGGWGGGGLCLAGRGVVAQTQSYYLVCILGILGKCRG